jgi:hypothetical protein
MQPKTINIIYWVLTILFCLAMLGDAFGGITKQQAGVDSLTHLGYPLYLLPLVGYMKILGVVAILQQKVSAIKEWAYAGFAFTFILAFSSRFIVGDSIGLLIPPVIMLIIMLLAYYFWKKKTVLHPDI